MNRHEPDNNPARFAGKAEELAVLGAAGGEPLGLVSDFSADGQAATLLFNKLTVSLDSRQEQLTAARIVSLSIPLENNTHGVCPTQDIAGHVAVQGSAKTLLFIRVGGNTAVIDPNAAKKQEEADSSSFDFIYSLESAVPAGSECRIIFILFAERAASDPEASALLTVDSLDIAMNSSLRTD